MGLLFEDPNPVLPKRQFFKPDIRLPWLEFAKPRETLERECQAFSQHGWLTHDEHQSLKRVRGLRYSELDPATRGLVAALRTAWRSLWQNQQDKR